MLWLLGQYKRLGRCILKTKTLATINHNRSALCFKEWAGQFLLFYCHKEVFVAFVCGFEFAGIGGRMSIFGGNLKRVK